MGKRKLKQGVGRDEVVKDRIGESGVVKNEVITIEITGLGSEGEGIGKYNGYTLFVKEALPGELVEARVLKMKKSYGYAKIERVVRCSPDRVVPVCELASKCGGCQLQHLSYEKQLVYKEDKIAECFSRIGGLDRDFVLECKEDIIGMDDPLFYRNKARFPVGKDKDGNVIAGFFASRSHSIMDVSKCFIQAECNEDILNVVKGFLQEFDVSIYDEVSHSGLVRHVISRVGFATNEIMVCLVINGSVLPFSDVLVERLRRIHGVCSICLNVNTLKSNVILGDRVITIFGEPFITDMIGDVSYRISPLSFYQVNPVQTRKLYEKALEYCDLSGNEVVWDLYCGIGTISLFLARMAGFVYGVEIVPQAVRDARVNASINGIGNVEFFAGAAEEVAPTWKDDESKIADVVVVDPPRKGCDVALLQTVVDMHPEKIVYVSCDPATLARDVKWLGGYGYGMVKWCGVDQFGWTGHVECVVLMSRKDE